MPVRALTPALAEKARVELNEDPKRVESDIQHLKDWLAKQPHIKARTDDQWLIIFLRGCKFSLERAKEKLDLYYTMRTAVPEFFNTKPTDPLFHEILDLGCIVILPKPIGPDQPVVTLVRPGAYDPSKYSMLDIMSTASTIQKILLLENDNSVVAGFKSIMDLEGSTMAHFLQMTPLQMKKMIMFSQEAAPIRMKGFHYLNTPSWFETILNATKTFLNEKNKARLYVHNKNYEELYKHVPKEVLPAEYGGSAGTIKEINNHWRQKAVEYKDWLEEDQQFCTDESKRLGKPKTAEEMFGLDGSFRQLDFD